MTSSFLSHKLKEWNSQILESGFIKECYCKIVSVDPREIKKVELLSIKMRL